MPIYVAMLRGINVGPHKRMKMEKLRQAFEALGFHKVTTYIQSGNVVFESGKTSPTVLSKKIEARIVDDFGFAAPVICRTAEQMSAAVANNPLLKQRGIDPEKLHVMFLAEAAPSAAPAELAKLPKPPEQLHCDGQEVYLYLPNGVSQSFLMKLPPERILPVTHTTRNWKTVQRLWEMCEEHRR